MEWLRIQLKIMRERGVKAILMGHVPPARVDSKESWDETCWQKYTLWVQQYRDVIVGSLYGHMNIDHFMLQDFEQIKDNTRKGDMAAQTRAKNIDGEIRLLEDGEVTVASASDYLLSLRDFWARLPSPLAAAKHDSKTRSELWADDDDEDRDSIWNWLMSMVTDSRKHKKTGKSAKKKYLEKIGGKYAQRYSASLVSPSVVPNYFPTLRIIEYNITGLEHLHVYGSSDASGDQHILSGHEFSDDEGYKREIETLVRRKEKQKNKERAAKHKKKFRFKVPEGPSKSAPPGPAYSPQPLTWTGYVQYFANLTRINNDFVDPQHHRFEAEPTSANDLTPRTIFGLQVSESGEIEGKGWKEGKHKKHNGKHPRPKPNPKEFVYEVEYDTKDKKFPDLTVRRWVEYARKIGGGHGAKAADVYDFEEDDLVEDELDVEADEDKLEAEGKKHKKHKKGKKHHKAPKEWFTFVKRAFVETMDPHEIKQVFGRTVAPVDAVQEEIMEL